MNNDPAYIAISAYYGDRKAERSGVPLMKHIDHGLLLLQKWGRSAIEMQAWCLHPLAQAGNVPAIEGSELAKEYAIIANSYLCTPENDRMTLHGKPYMLAMSLPDFSIECAWLLLTDKVQNQIDFRTYHWFSHPRAEQLERYFNLWIETLLIYKIKL